MIVPKSIVVLPFKNLSSSPENEYFSDGMTEEIINALSQIDGLKVTARTSSFVFKNANRDIRTIGKELGVSLALEGSVRKSNDRLRINAKLIRTEDGFQIWSKNFDRNMIDVFELQDEISLLIADKIREHFGHLSIEDHLVKKSTNNVEAYQYYLKGRYQYNKWSMQGFAEAAREFEKSINEDPRFALPYFGAGLSYSFLGSWGTMDKQSAFQLAEDYFARGNNQDTQSAYGYYSLAKHQFWGLWNYQEAHKNLLKTYALQPQDSDTNEFLAEIHTLAGNFSTALKYIETSLQIDPLSPSHYYTKANIYYLQGRIPEALKVIEKGLVVEPSFVIALELKMACLIQFGLKEPFLKTVSLYESPLQEVFELIYQSIQDQQVLDIRMVNKMILNFQQAEHPPLLAWDLYLLVHSGHVNEALQLLSKKAAQKMGQVINFKYDPLLKPLRGSNPYRELAAKYFPGNVLLTIGKRQPKGKDFLSPEAAQHYVDLLLLKMEKEQIYLDANLGLKDLAGKINLHPNKLSWLLNERIGKNFYTFVNSYRLEDFQKRAIDPQNEHLSLLGLAYESGFNSKSVFNDYFKKTTGLTPKAWVRQRLES